MADWYTREMFFRPSELRRKPFRLLAPIYNNCRRLLARAEQGCVFVPIRSMAFLAVIDAAEVVFVDSQGGYRVVDGRGGRLILLSWQLGAAAERDSLSDPVPCEVVYYADAADDDLQRRLIGEFPKALEELDEKGRAGELEPHGATIVPLRQG